MPRFSFKVSYFAEGRRFQKLFADLDEAKVHAKKEGRGHRHLKWLKAVRAADAAKKRAKGKKSKPAKASLLQARPGQTFLPDQTAVKYVPCQWKKNTLRHSYISYRVADIQDVPKVALEAGNSPQMIFPHYREPVKPEAAKERFAIVPSSDKTPA